jgi:ABC-2 type transport system permease protein
MAELYLFRASLKDLFRVKKMGVALVLALLPALIAVLWRTGSHGDFDRDMAYSVLSGDFIFGFVLVILAVVFGTGVVTQETEQKTIVYLLTRPVPRWRILLVKFVVALLAVIVTVWLASVALAITTFGIADLGKSRLGRDFAILPIGALAYIGLFLFLAVVFKRPLVAGLLFAFGWESWVPNLQGSFQKTSLMAYLRALSPHPKPPDEAMDMQNFLLSMTGGADTDVITKALAWKVLIGVALVTLAGSLFLFSTREFSPREDAD